MQTKTYMGREYVQDPATGEWVLKDNTPAQQPSQPRPQGVLLPPPPPPPPSPPPRTPSGEATEGLPQGMVWIDPKRPELGYKPADRVGGPNVTASDLTPGQVASDEFYVKEYYNPWRAGGGLAGFNKNLDRLQNALDILETSDTITGSIYGRLPKFIQQQVDPRGPDVKAQVETVIQQSLKQLLGGQFAMKEAEQLFGRAYDETQPEQSNIKRIKTELDDLRERAKAAESIARYYEEFGTISGWTPEYKPKISALDVIRTDGAPAAETRAAGRTDANNPGMTTDPYPEEMITAHDAMVSRLARDGQGRINPQAYADAREKLFREFGYDPGPREENEAWAKGVNDYLNAGGRTIPTGILPNERLMTRAETMRNNLINNPVSAAGIGVANTFSLGIPEAFAPDEMTALRDAQATTTLGEIGGVVLGTGAVGAIGRGATNFSGRALNRQAAAQALLSNAPRARIARNVGTDAAYAGTYGTVTGDDPATSIVAGSVGSLAGQGVAGAGLALGRGLQRLPEAVRLRNAGIPVSVARQIGGSAARAEDLMQSVPFAGAASRNRQVESFEAFDREALRRAAEPIGYNPTGIGRQAVDDLGDAAGRARNNVLGGQPIPIDAEYLSRASNAIDPQIPANVRGDVEDLLGTRLNRIIQDDALTPENYGITMSRLKENRANPSQKFQDYAPEFRTSMTNAMDAASDLIRRSGRADVIKNLDDANTAYRDYKILDDATNRAMGGGASGEVDVFTPYQLKAAAVMARRKGFGKSDLRDFANDGQKVLPSTLPNSGSADRAIAAGLLASAAGGFGLGGSGVGDQNVSDAANVTGTTASGLLAAGAGLGLLGTRRGQDILEKALFDRPENLRKLMDAAAQQRLGGLFGGAGAAGGTTGSYLFQDWFN